MSFYHQVQRLFVCPLLYLELTKHRSAREKRDLCLANPSTFYLHTPPLFTVVLFLHQPQQRKESRFKKKKIKMWVEKDNIDLRVPASSLNLCAVSSSYI